MVPRSISDCATEKRSCPYARSPCEASEASIGFCDVTAVDIQLREVRLQTDTQYAIFLGQPRPILQCFPPQRFGFVKVAQCPLDEGRIADSFQLATAGTYAARSLSMSPR